MRPTGVSGTYGLFVPNDGDQATWLLWAGDGISCKLAAGQHVPVNVQLVPAMTVEKEKVPVCVPELTVSGRHRSRRRAFDRAEPGEGTRFDASDDCAVSGKTAFTNRVKLL
jgi:hypothetical protein